MLNGTRFITFHFVGLLLTKFIAGFEGDEFGAFHVAGVIGNRKATFASYHRPALRDDFRIDQNQTAVMMNIGFVLNIHNNDTLEPPYLRRCDTDGTGS